VNTPAAGTSLRRHVPQLDDASRAQRGPPPLCAAVHCRVAGALSVAPPAVLVWPRLLGVESRRPGPSSISRGAIRRPIAERPAHAAVGVSAALRRGPELARALGEANDFHAKSPLSAPSEARRTLPVACEHLPVGVFGAPARQAKPRVEGAPRGRRPSAATPAQPPFRQLEGEAKGSTQRRRWRRRRRQLAAIRRRLPARLGIPQCLERTFRRRCVSRLSEGGLLL